MKKNEEYIVECLDVTNLGAGVTKVDGMTVFVNGLITNEKARIRIVKVLKNYAYGIIRELIVESDDRIKPLCPISHQCGGCQFQHIAYNKQLDIKTDSVRQLFERQVDPSIEVFDTLGMEDPYYYRNKAQFPVQVVDGIIKTGFYRIHSNDIVPCKMCNIQNKTINEVYEWICDNLTVTEAKQLRHIFIRVSTLGYIQVVWIARQNCFERLTEKLVRKFPNVTGVVYNQNRRKDNVILGDTYKVLYGKAYLEEKCLSNYIQLNFQSFYQVNPKQMEVLYQKAIEFADLKGNEKCIDLYSGVGTIAMSVSPYVQSITGVEIVEEAVMNAAANAKRNHLNNCTFVCEDASKFVENYKEHTDVVFVDPPRRGLTSMGIEHICRLEPKKIVYISCNPQTLARDSVLLKENGYHCQKVQPVDMFPQTTGLECVSLFIKI